MMKVELSLAQSRIFNARAERRFRVVVAGRRFGKTTLALTELLAAAMGNPGSENWYVAPTYRQAKLIAWKALNTMCPPEIVHGVHQTELSLELTNGAMVRLKGADNFDSLRGAGLDNLVLDEFATMKPDAWEEVLRPALSDKLGRAMFIGTPGGFNHFYDLYCHATDPANRDWWGWQFTTADGGWVPPEELVSARSEMDEKTYRAEYEASFESVAGRVYWGFDRELSVSSQVEDQGGPLLIGMDFNVDPMSCVVGCRAADELHIFDEVVLSNSNTEEMADHIEAKYATRGLTDLELERIRAAGRVEGTTGVTTRRRDVIICPDPSGKARKTSAPVGQTDFTILRRHGWKVSAPSSAPAVVDRINTVNALLKDAAGHRRLKIHPRCKHLIKSLDGLVYKPETNQPDKTSGLDHQADALGYLVMQQFPMAGRRAVTKEVLF